MRVTRTKLYQDYLIDVRDYEAKQCIELRESLIITYKKEKMTLTPKQLKDDCVQKGKKLHSVKGTPPYYLWSYVWTPDESPNEKVNPPCFSNN